MLSGHTSHKLISFEGIISFRKLNAMTRESERQIASDLYQRLFPICRSITGKGLRNSLDIMKELMPLSVLGVKSGTQVYDWVVPEEWNIHNAWLKGPDGKIYADFKKSNLSVVNYSEPVYKKLSKTELLPHLHTLPHLPDAIPYVTSYYKKNWGFCLDYKTYQSLPEGEYEVFIDSQFSEGEVTVADSVLAGESKKEIFLSSYLCHPSMANNELSGPIVLALLYQRIAKWPKRRFSYRFVLNPETIGSLCYLSLKEKELRENMQAGVVLTCLGGKNKTLSFKHTRGGNNSIDEIIRYSNEIGQSSIRERDFTPMGGSDERQYNSPGFKLPVGQFARDIYGEYPYYHTSLDNLEFMGIDSLIESVNDIEKILKLHELAGHFINLAPYGEPQLGKRGLYPNINSPMTWGKSSDDINDQSEILKSIIYILNYCDGEHSMISIAKKLNIPLSSLEGIIERLESEKLIKLK
jgi:aminopeptidase-like protein